MPRLLSVLFLLALVAAVLFASSNPAYGNHVQCGDVITRDTKLDADLVDCANDGLVIGADDVTLDLNGHTVDGDGVESQECEAGIVNGPWSFCPRPGQAGHDRVTIRNGFVRDFFYGVRLRGTDANELRRLRVSHTSIGMAVIESNNARVVANSLSDNLGRSDATGLVLGEDSNNNRIEANDLSRNGAYGIHAEGVDNNWFVRNTMSENGNAAVHLHAARQNVLEHNRVFGNPTGIELSDGVHENRVFNNWVFANAYIGIMTQEGAHGNRIQRNFVFDNGGLATGDASGIVLFGDGHGEEVEGNVVFGNYRGILIWPEAHDNQVSENWISHNSNGGIVLTPGPVGVDRIEWNAVVRNGGDGIFVGEGPYGRVGATVIGQNVSSRNEDDGIDVESTAAEVTRNRANRNGDLGIEAVPGVTDGGGNQALGNDNPLQCLNVACGKGR
jgi:large repetitive protein